MTFQLQLFEITAKAQSWMEELNRGHSGYHRGKKKKKKGEGTSEW